MDISKAFTLSAHALQVRDDRLRALAATLAAPAAPIQVRTGPFRGAMAGSGARSSGSRTAGSTGLDDERRARDANLSVLGATRSLLNRTIEMLR